MKRKIFITGGFGYVGGRIAQMLAENKDLQIILGKMKKKSC